ncbi:Fibronectin type III domain protein [Fimbriiglobus ruber]|uniref:Fibronectin type III domain protein n=1 Tax=Fimbriiglobus ruber TaxID=1908690 RepID=A0A225E0M1_9BACT|nr:Fibronectin type III domain protein [Fimbriiglobus ruber]
MYRDANNNGAQGGGEPGIQNVILNLTGTDDQGNAVNQTTVTDANGTYTFSVRPSQSGTGYTLTETQPSGYLQGKDTIGSLGGDPVSQTPTTDTVPNIEVPVYTHGTSYNFGELQPASLSGSVFAESDNNAIQNAGEPPIAGVTLVLTGTNDLGVITPITAATNASGQYSFTSLRPATGNGYTITETQPTGYNEEKDNPGSPVGNVTVQDVISAIPLGVGVSGTSYNFAESGAALSGTVYEDKNANGVFDGGDGGVSGATLTLTGTDIAGNAVNVTTTTNAGGAFAFSYLRQSNAAGYTITETQPAGYLEGRDTAGNLAGNTAVQDVISGIVTTTGSAGTSYNFGEVMPAQLSGAVFVDPNLNAVKDAGEPAISGVTLVLTGTDAYGASVALTTTTNSAGAYSFTSLRPSNGAGYTVTETQPAGFNEGIDNAGSPAGNINVQDVISAIPVADNGTGTSYNFGELGASISGTIYEDKNADGVLDAGDAGISGVTVVLTGSDITGTAITPITATTNASGQFTFSNLRQSNGPGYTITETQPSGYLEGADTVGTFGAAAVGSGTVQDVISGVVTPSGGTGTSYNFGAVKPAQLSGAVFVDPNRNGIQDPGEPAISGVTLVLTGQDAFGASANATATTNSAGAYSFTSLRPSNGAGYTVTETQPTGFNEGVDNAGSPAGSISAQDVISAIPVADNGNGTSYNFGELGASISGVVYQDTNLDGVLDAGDTGLTGVTVVLTGSDITGAAITPITATTNASGQFTLSNLRQSNAAGYTITETQPGAFAEGADTVGNFGGAAVGNGSVQDIISGIVTPSGGAGTSYNFGELSPGNLSGRVFVDGNNNGVFDGTDSGISGVTLVLSGMTVFGAPVAMTTTTDATGQYGFTAVPPSNASGYTITETQPSGFLEGVDTVGSLSGNDSVQDVVSSIVLPNGGNGTSYNFAELNPITIAGTVFLDANNNGIQDPGDVGLAGVTVVVTGTDYSGHSVNQVQTTNGSGDYTFISLSPSNGAGYTVTETQPIGYGQGIDTAGNPTNGNTTVQDAISVIIATTPNTNLVGYNFAEIGQSLSGTVYEDKDASGSLTAGDSFLSGVTLVLTGVDDAGNPVDLTVTTNASGVYSFVNLRSSNGVGYTITETQPGGFLEGLDTQGSLGGNIGVIDVVSGIVLGSTNGTSYNFGEVSPASLSGVVFDDSGNNDGVKQAGDPAISGVTLVLTGTDAFGGTVSQTQVTGASGTYAFTSLRPSNGSGYTVTESQPATFLQGRDTAGVPSDGTIASQTATQDVINAIAVGDAAALVSYNFGELQASSLSGTVFADPTGNAIRQVGDPGIAGVTVVLTGADFAGNSVNQTQTTDSSGDYTFTGLPPSNGAGYTITESQPSGYNQGSDNPGNPAGNVTVQDVISGIVVGAGGVTGTSYNFAETGESLSGTVYEDTDASGSLTGGDVAIAGVTLVLTGTDIAGAAVTVTVTTDASGVYSFTNVRSSNAAGYTITETQPGGFLEGADTQGSLGGDISVIDVVSGVVLGLANGTSYNFGEVSPASLSGVVFDDSANNDGVKQAGDPAIPGVTLVLTGTDAFGGTVSQTQVTGASGTYAFTSLRPSNGSGYTVTESQPATFLQGRDTAGVPSDGTIASQTATQDVINAIAVGDAAALVSYNFGELQASSLSGTVFNDFNGNGTQDSGELGIAGVTLVLTGTDFAGDSINQTQTTDSSGDFTFTGLRPSNGAGYTITESQPANAVQGIDTAGSPTDGTVASQTATQDVINAIAINANAALVGFNFGELKGVSLSGVVFDNSAGNDGLMQTGEPPIARVTVVLSGTSSHGPITPITTTTGADGSFVFSNLLPSAGGGYTVTETQPSGFLQGKDTAGSPASGTVSQNGSQDVVSGITTNGTDLTGYNFAELEPASISGRVFSDLNNDGLFQPGEGPIAGVTVVLTGTDDTGAAVSLTSTTGNDGAYQFTNLRPSRAGGYVLTVTQPAGFTPGLEHAGELGGSPTQNTISAIFVVAGNNGADYNFAEIGGSLSGFVFNDFNYNGVFDTPVETGIAGSTVALTGVDTVGNAVAATTTTGSDGSFTFDNLRQSNAAGYTLTESPPTGYFAGTDTAGTLAGSTNVPNVVSNIVLASGANGVDYRFAELQSPAITSAAATTLTVGTAGTFTVTTGPDFPAVTLSESGALPAGVTFVDNGDGTATLAGTPAVGVGGTFVLTITAANSVTPDATQAFTLTVDEAPSITSAAATTLAVGTAGAFTVTTAHDFPTATALTESGTLPVGVTFHDNGDGTATLAGTPAAGTGGTYTLTVTAANGVTPDATQTYTLTVNEPPTITSAAATTLTVGTAGAFTVATAHDFPAATTLTESGTLPTGITFVDNGDGTATLAGTPAAGAGGTYTLTVTAANGVTPDATQAFTLTVDEAPSITSAAATTLTVGTAGTFTVATGHDFPTATLTETGALPVGVTFHDNGDGIATLAGTPAVGTGGTYAFTITAVNGVTPDATQTFTLTVDELPTITSAATTTLTVGAAGTFTVATGHDFPTATLTETGALPVGVTFHDNGDGTATLAGTPAAGVGGTFAVTITAANGVTPDATQTFTLTVDEAPSITSAATTTFITGVAGTFTVATGHDFPGATTLTETGTLPSGVTFVDDGDGTATLGGTPAAGAGGTYTFTITAANGVTPNATQTFTLTVDEPPTITSAATTTFTTGAAGTFTVATEHDFPTATTLTETGALPSGVTFVDDGDGTATLAGTPAAGVGGTFALTITAANGVTPDATQTFTLTVDEAPSITSAAATTLTTGAAGAFTVTTAHDFPTATALSESGTLPSGVTFVDNGDGTASLAGTPAAGAGGTYAFTITAANGVTPDATQAFTLTVDEAPPITSAAATTLTVGTAGAFTVTTGHDFPTATTLTESGTLPTGVTFVDNGDGIATLAGTPAGGTGGTYAFTITAANGVTPNATQTFTLTVDEAPSITSAAATTLTVGTAGTFTVATGHDFPTATLTETGALPAGVTFVDSGDGTATLAGTPAAGTGGTYSLTVTAANGVAPDATQAFTLTVDASPVFTSTTIATTSRTGTAVSTTLTASGFPVPIFSIASGQLPTGLTLNPNTGAITGTPTAVGTFSGTFATTNSAGAADQPFTLTISPSQLNQNDVSVFAISGSATSTPLNSDGSSAGSPVTPFGTVGTVTAVADVTGDGTPDQIIGSGPGIRATVVVVDGATGAIVMTLHPFEDSFTGGVFVAAADVNGDGYADIAVSADVTGGGRVQIYDGKTGMLLADFFGIADSSFRGGARVAFGDVNGDGRPDLIVSAGDGGGPRIAIFDGRTLEPGQTPTRLVSDFFAFEPTLRDGAYVTAGDVNGDGKADLIFGGGPTGAPRVLVVDGSTLLSSQGQTLTPLADFFAGDSTLRGGVVVAAKDLDGDNQEDLVVAVPQTNGTAEVFSYLGKDLAPGTTPPVFKEYGPVEDPLGVYVG